MSILKATLATLIFILVWNLISCWILLAYYFDCTELFVYYSLINNGLMFGIVVVFMFRRKITIERALKKTDLKWCFLAIVLGFSFVFVQTPLKWVYNFVFQSNYYIIYRFDGFRTLTGLLN